MRFFLSAAAASMVLLALPFSSGADQAAAKPDAEATTHRLLPPVLPKSTEKFGVVALGPRQVTRGAVYALTITITRHGLLSNALTQVGLPTPTLTPEQQAQLDAAKLKFLAEQAAKNNGLEPEQASDLVSIGLGTAKIVDTFMEGGSRRRLKRRLSAGQGVEATTEEEEEQTELVTKRMSENTKRPRALQSSQANKITPPPNGVKYGLRVSIPSADAAFATLQNVKTTPFIPFASRFPAKSTSNGTNILIWRNLPMTTSTVKDTMVKITLRFKLSKTTPVNTVLDFTVSAFTYDANNAELAVETAPVVMTTVVKSKWGR